MRLSAISGLTGFAGLAIACQSAATPAAPTKSAAPVAPAEVATPAAAPAGKPATTGPATAPAKTKVRYGMLKFAAASVEAPFYYMADEKGFFAEQGLDIEYVPIVGGSVMVQGVVSKDLTFGLGDAGVLRAATEGANIVIIGTILPKAVFTFFARKDRGINTLKDLEGKAVGTSGPGSIFEVLTLAIMKKQGLDPNKLQLVNIGSSVDIWNALQAGKIDAALTNYEFIPGVEKTEAKVLSDGDAHAAVPDYLFQSIFVHGDTLKQMAEPLTRLLVAMAKGVRYTLDHQDEAVTLAAKASGRTATEAKPLLDIYINKKVYNPNLDFTAKQIEYTQQVNIDIGAQKTMLPFEQVATLDLQRRVVEVLGSYRY